MNHRKAILNQKELNKAPGPQAGSGPQASSMLSGSAISGVFSAPYNRGVVAPNATSTGTTAGANASRAISDYGDFSSHFYTRFKRVGDTGVSIIALSAFSLILPLLAVVIKLDSPGSLFFSQERVGLNRRKTRSGFAGGDRRKIMQPGRPFKVIKLRTMGVNAEANGPQWASKDDVRVTRVGRFLRKTRLDEVPQFLNVLRGEMSLIGPRPERLVFVRQLEKEIPYYHERLKVLPGITGLAQVLNGYDDDLESVRRKVELDRQYIKKAGFRQDSKILINTVGVVLKGEGAR
ncbi:MAG: lipopolysaccharide/colanic/teichoic acid biosynthesis glycosyltransferase [Candidatus Krumholzibacteriia bacterium]|jgi:lipopolysaccharide/colanic/teichoic acid biosynthesis glycosyltransferase